MMPTITRFVKDQSFLSGVLLMVFFLVFLIISAGYPFRGGLVPIIVSALGLALSALYLISIIFPRLGKRLQSGYFANLKMDAKVCESDEEAPPPQREIRNMAIVIGWVCATAILIILIGFSIGTPIAVFIYLMWFRRIFWLKSVLVTIGIFVLVYVVFQITMRVILFPGILFGGIIT